MLLFFASASSEMAKGAKINASAKTTAVDTSNVLVVFILVNFTTTIQYLLDILDFQENVVTDFLAE
ncbi:protein of unknown function [Candidatus Nitrosocosmicus franklandus]|uniref:Uncharacterized protein n=1 Tax=Candidatus Nitrosocosmicus franklandianus TaxID=1798806 RepID=A0A484II93_9ARCH|nr:protein of unknown function [Candidatus Nitrosocosmicus franklandus]